MADHNDPNAVNSIFSDIDVSAADLYDLFGFPSDDTTGGEKVVIALTFASVPETGVFDTDMLYRIQITAHPRVALPSKDDHSLEALLKYFDNMVRPKRSHFSNISGILAPEREICPDCHEAEGRLFGLASQEARRWRPEKEVWYMNRTIPVLCCSVAANPSPLGVKLHTVGSCSPRE